MKRDKEVREETGVYSADCFLLVYLWADTGFI